MLVYSAGATGSPLPIQLASQGTLSVVTIFGLIYSFLREVHPHLPENRVFEAPGIVIVDEVDAHLHPSWQQKILAMLTSTFPNVQYIVSAHSPFIVAGCDQGEVSVLRRQSETGLFQLDPLSQDFLAARAGDIYKQAFEVAEVDRLYLEYSAKAFSSDSLEHEIDALEKLQPRSETQDARLDQLYRELRLVNRARSVRQERLENERSSARIQRLEAEIERLQAVLLEQNAPKQGTKDAPGEQA
nr:AAA family ATPase [Bradyrhizobium vignae]